MSVLVVIVILSGCNRGAVNKSQAQLAKTRQQLKQAQAQIDAQKADLKKAGERLREIHIQLPPASEAMPITMATSVVVEIGQDGQLEFNGQPATQEQLQEFLDEAVKKDVNQSITIRGRKQTPLEQVANIMSMCQRAGIANYNVAMRPEE